VVGFLIALVLLLAHGAPYVPITYLELSNKHPYDSFWINSTAVFLLTNNGYGFHTLYLSTDEGQTWQEQNLPDPTGICYVIRIYQDPNNSQQLILLGPPEIQCGWQTFDGGQTYKFVSPPGIQRLSFHPNVTGWALGVTADSTVHVTRTMGAQWDQVNASAASWILTSEYKDLPITSIYLIRSGTFGYSGDLGASFVPQISSANLMYTSANFIYVLLQDLTLVVGRNKNNFQSALFPFGAKVKIFTVSDDITGATWFLTDDSFYWGSIYTAGATGALYVQSLQHVLKRDDAILDFHSVRGLPGIHLANVVVNYNDFRDLQLNTYITYDNGGQWSALPPPNGYFCVQCNLNLYFSYNSLSSRPFYSSPNTIGIIIANGHTGTALSYDNPMHLSTYISRDAGRSWDELILPVMGPYLFEFGDHGGILVLAPQNEPVSSIYYSLDEGLTIIPLALPTFGTVWITRIETEKTATSRKFLVYALLNDGSSSAVVYGFDFSQLQTRICGDGDYETWIPNDGYSTKQCWLGRHTVYSRRIRTADCTNDRDTEHVISSENCECTLEDYECDFGFSPNPTSVNFSCIVTGVLPPDPPTACNGTYDKTQGYRLVPGDACVRGLDRNPIVKSCPIIPITTNPASNAWIAVVIILVVIVVLGVLSFIIYRDPALRGKILSALRLSKITRYSRVKARSNSLAGEDDFGIHDDLLEDGGEEDAKVLHDNDISKASSAGSSRSTRSTNN
jgi:hypothetical protein